VLQCKCTTRGFLYIEKMAVKRVKQPQDILVDNIKFTTLTYVQFIKTLMYKITGYNS